MLYDTKAILEDADIEAVLSFCNTKYTFKYGRYLIECPDHVKNFGRRDRHLGNCSMEKNGRYFCRSCNARGDLFNLVMANVGVSFPEACEIVANCSCGSAESYELNEKRTEEIQENRSMKDYLNTIGLSGHEKTKKNITRINGCILTEVYTEEEAKVYEEEGYRVEKEGYDTVPLTEEEIANGDVYDPVRWVIYDKEKPMSLMLLKKYHPALFKQLLLKKEEEAKELADFINELAELIPDPDVYKGMKNFAKEQREIIRRGGASLH